MSLFDIFSSSDGKKAAQSANNARITGLEGAADALTTGYNNAYNSTVTGLTGANDARIAGLNTGFESLSSGFDDALALYTSAQGNAETELRAAADPFTQLLEGDIAGNDLYLDALGINGPEGNARAVAAFQEGPGFQFALDTGLQALDRQAASRGQLNSGTTNLDTINYAQGLANQEYNNYINQLSQFGGRAQTSAANQANVLGDIANLFTEGATQQGDLITELARAAQTRDVAIGDSNANTQLGIGTAGATMDLGTAQALANLATGTGESQAQLAADEFAAEQSANQNIFNAITNIAQLAAGFAG